MVVGVTGKYCAGKNALIGILKRKGYLEIDVDRIGHLALEKEKKRVIERFGSSVRNEKRGIDRKKLGALVFKNHKGMNDLERIVHPEMVGMVKSRIEATDAPAVINAAVLFKMGLHRFCDLVICVQAPILKRLRRALARDRLSLLQVLRRIAAQKGICPKSNEYGVDIYYIENKKDLIFMEEQAFKILAEKGIKENRNGKE